MKFTIPFEVKTKKNGQRVIKVGSSTRIIPGKPYVQFEKDALPYCPPYHINKPVNLKAVFFMATHRKIDLNNALAFTDMLVKAGTIEDDNSNIIVSFDGSRIAYDKHNPRIEVEITEVTT